MGHANAAMTLNVYATADSEAKKSGAEAVERMYQVEVAKHYNDGEVLELGKTGTEE